MEYTNKTLALRYAIPCIDDVISLGIISENDARKAIHLVKNGNATDESLKLFNFADIMCERTAIKMGKSQIDSEAIRAYYLVLHNKVIHTHKPLTCSIEDCKVKVVEDLENYKKTFVDKIPRDHLGVVHRGYLVDFITSSEMEEILSKFSCLETP